MQAMNTAMAAIKASSDEIAKSSSQAQVMRHIIQELGTLVEGGRNPGRPNGQPPRSPRTLAPDSDLDSAGLITNHICKLDTSLRDCTPP
jgi:hypothetical protein